MISNMLRFPLSMFDDELDDWFFPRARPARHQTRSAYPPVNVGSTEKNVDVYLFVPGMDAEALDVVIEKNLLSVAGERKLVESTESEGDFTRKERYEGQFKRVITLPEEVDTESAEAVYRDGVLHINLAKQMDAKPRQIQISVH
ncbi:MAG: Hsp20/alpha crystallin family protein [Gammaproteobacteria bacterium]|jgi:HSP20 family protein|nr:Hsp20/alpha crystallin family protein [Gammaproteobacteria bacterium]MBT3725397.1 Hsp20/alpha crystallin family protein [Gammaproteobacteria bacterium]MBT4076684.1 Hsp20/alpha crystallin family protein [Gammaproteobacteria bacterium]MBT4193967.1 Hsp20/alpha crystallin family protein [Gammaproteobacteria bacterium]MBT4448345.1 Hsp20/alpha crystallin family protein [Gammaproteobacteria bacterium]